jgi:hypothetical protein
MFELAINAVLEWFRHEPSQLLGVATALAFVAWSAIGLDSAGFDIFDRDGADGD